MWFLIIASAAVADYDISAHGRMPLERCEAAAQRMYVREAEEVRAGYDMFGNELGAAVREDVHFREYYCAKRPDDRETWQLQPRPEESEIARVKPDE